MAVATHTILIIDDEKSIRDSLAAHLEDCGHCVLEACDGRAGVEVFERQRPDLVLVDLRMPEMDGLDVLAHIRRTASQTPTIVVSGTGVISDAVEALHQGAWDYVLKPIEDFSVLDHAVAGCLEKARLQRENQEYQQRLEQMVAVRTAELEQANGHLRQINQRLRRIVETTRCLAFCTQVERFGSLLLEEFGEHMMATGGSLYLVEKDGLRLMHALDPGHAKTFIPFPLAPGSVFAQVIAQRQPSLIRDLEADPGIEGSGWPGYRDGSALVFPLPDESGAITGVLALHSKSPPPFVEQDHEIGMILASYSCEALRAVRATEDLRANEKRFREILDTIQTGIIAVDAGSYRILYANPMAADMIGCPLEEIVGRVCHDFICSDDQGCCPALEPGRQVELSEGSLKTAAGSLMPVLKAVSRTVLQGRECLLESFTDLSAQKRAEAEKTQLERQLRQAQKMEALGTLAGGIAHDFNNILGAVLGYAELGLHELGSATHPLSGKLRAIYRAGQRARDLVGQILAFSRMQERTLEPLRIGPIVKEALKLLRSSLPAGIDVQCEIRNDNSVLADATQIHQVVMNLCTNAYHAMQGSGGVLRVVLESVSLTPSQAAHLPELAPGDYLRLTVTDTGCGISPGVIDRIFEPYFTTKDKTKGTGLGLAVVHGIVRSHHGAITVSSQLGRGTEIQVCLPVVAGNDAHQAQATPPPLPHGSEHVLLVDDEEALVEIAHQMLEMLGYRVTAVVGGRAALEALRRPETRCDVLITDLNMPGLSGVQLAQEAARSRPGVPIILCTGFSERFDQERVKSYGIRRLLMKPLTMEDLARAVRAVLDEPHAGGPGGA